MPLLNARRKYRYKRQKESLKTNNENYKYVYNTSIWKKLRLNYLAQNPLCERCIITGRYISAVDVHHKIRISDGKTIAEKQALGFNWNNLESLCIDCHKKEHEFRHLN